MGGAHLTGRPVQQHPGPAFYQDHLVPRLFAPLAERLVALVGARAGDHGPDVACGTGAVARRLAAGVRVTGVDVNPGMLATARSLDPDLTRVEGDARALPFAPASFDLVTCQQGLQFIPDRAAAVRSIRAVLPKAGASGCGSVGAAEHTASGCSGAGRPRR